MNTALQVLGAVIAAAGVLIGLMFVCYCRAQSNLRRQRAERERRRGQSVAARPQLAAPAPRANSASVRGIRVAADARPLWQVRGWRRDGSRLTGAFRTPYGAMAGEIVLHGSAGMPDYFVFNPCEALLRGEHSACFRPRGKSSRGNRYWVHFSRPTRDVDGGIMAIENLLVHALGRRRS